MNSALAVLKLVALVLLCAILAPIAYEVWHQRPAFESDVRRVSALIGRTEQTMDNFKEATDEWKSASKEQTSSTTRVLSNADAAVARFTSFVSRTDDSLNSNFLPTLSTTVREQNAALLESQKDLQANLAGIALATQQLQKTLSDADQQISNPAIGQSIDNLATATQHASEATAHLAGITKAGEDTALYYQKKLETPESFFKTLAKVVLQLGSEGRILFNK